MKKLIIILYPFKFRQFDLVRFEVNELKKNNDIIIFEFVGLLYPHFIKAYFVDKNIKKRIYTIENLSLYKIEMDNLILKYGVENILILNFVKNDSFTALKINYYIKKNFLRSVNFFNPGISIYNQKILKTNYSFIKKISILFERKYETLQKIKGKFINFLVLILKLYPNFILVAGSKCKKDILDYTKKKGIQIIDGHSWDFSQILSKKKKYTNSSNYAIYLDAPGPKFFSDSYLYGEKMPETIEHTYPSLNNFFSYIENKLKLKVIISPHPKTKIQDRGKLFNGRRVISGRTHDLIKNSKMVVTRNSTAVCFAAYFNKPIILFYTNETFNTAGYRSSFDLAKSLKVKLININKFKKLNFKKILKIHKKIYKKYIYNFCTSKKNKLQNYKLINNLIKN
jgi:hypothetical protein